MHSTRNTFFDFLRLTAVLLVITSHYAYMFDTSPLITFPREYLTGGIGRLGVSLFFMISGALAYVSLTRYTAREYYVKRACSVLIPYNIVYFTAGLTLLALGLYFGYPKNPLEQLIKGERSVISFLPSVTGVDHYLHGVWGVETAYLTGEWFIGCIILLYIIAPLIFRILQGAPVMTMAATVVISVLCYNDTQVNPYWSAHVRMSDFTFGMFFMHFLHWFRKWRILLAAAGCAVILAGGITAAVSQKTIREILFPLAPQSLIFLVAFVFVFHAGYPVINQVFGRLRLQNAIYRLASRAYIIMLLQHVVIIFISANINMEKLNVGQAILFYGLILITTERVSVALKIAVMPAERIIVRYMLNKF
ncbi:acyltransferase [Lelliottia amnigena]|uniref:acyltransferase family protein n=1 Tax=Lelliottia TaxID=1330545 RepID=UPI00192C79B4|nr:MULTISPECIES: acyltransferase [Lelliottia]MBL5884913.1 acyltransferase [Lelliottia aquatilis]MBL5920672.1 acyltransferase [Lelliottia amnigena]MBL5932745.1 acyltransferase [Lelliottia amnigena]